MPVTGVDGWFVLQAERTLGEVHLSSYLSVWERPRKSQPQRAAEASKKAEANFQALLMPPSSCSFSGHSPLQSSEDVESPVEDFLLPMCVYVPQVQVIYPELFS